MPTKNQSQPILVVGSLAYDSVKTPSGAVNRALGGSANYFSLSASLFAPVRVVGVIGEDYEQKDIDLLKSRQVDLEGMTKAKGKTFHWAGSYEKDLNQAVTHATDLNVFADFNPQLPENYKNSAFVFLANIAPELQLDVLNQVQNPMFVGMDTMNFWISSKLDVLKKVLQKINLLLINDTEALLLTGKPNAVAAAHAITEMGPEYVIIKRGEFGCLIYSQKEGFSMLPAYPISTVVDPTGAGDTFAGGVFGSLAANGSQPNLKDIKTACTKASVMSSFTIQDFSVKALAQVSKESFEKRYQDYIKMMQV